MVVQDRRAAKREETIREILDAAWAQVSEVGVGELSLRRLAKSVGMKAPSLYVYFDSKNALYDALFADAARDFRDRYAAATLEVEDPLDAWRSGLECYLRFALENPARFQLHFQRPVPDFQPSPESYAIAEKTYETFVAGVRRLVDAGIFSPVALEQRSLDLITAISSGLASQQLSNQPDVAFDDGRWTGLIEDVIEMQRRHFGSGGRKEK